MNIPKTLIVTRTKNRQLLLERAIKSVLNQTNDSWIHVIVNDGGDPVCVDSLVEKYVGAYRDRFLVVHNNESRGMEAASNLGIAQINSDFILIHDDDDSLHPDFLEKTIAYLNNAPYPTIQGVCTWVNQIEEKIINNQVTMVRSKIFRRLHGGLCFSDVCGINPVPPISFVFRRSAFDAVGPYDETLSVLGDWEFLLRFLTRFDVGVIPEQLANYHIRRDAAGVLSNSINDRSERFTMLTKIIRNRFAREQNNTSFGLLIQLAEPMHRIQRIYSHPILGTVIRLWSKFINRDIPKSPF